MSSAGVPDSPDAYPLEALQRLTADEAPNLFGRRLGHLIATLHRGAELEPDASAWRRAYLQHWSTIEEVWLGGGVAAGLGEGLVRSARCEAGRLGLEAGALAAVIEAIIATRERVADADVEVILSVASYVDRGGRLVESHSRYAAVTAEVLQTALPAIRVQLVHDGTLAARGVQPSRYPAHVS